MTARMGPAGAFRRLAKGRTPRWVAAPVLLASNWLFQGMLIMDPAERRFKVALDVLLSALVTVLFLGATDLHAAWALGLAIVMGHTVNWLANGQLPVVLKNLGATRMDGVRRRREMERLGRRAGGPWGRRCLEAVHAYGSLSRGTSHERSDLDVRLLRRPGFGSALASCALALAERARATLLLLPLDIYVVDRAANLGKVIAAEELARPVVLWSASAGGSRPSPARAGKGKSGDGR